MRKGLGKVRHLETNQLWIQDRVRKGDLTITKVPGEENIADALTKYVSRDQIVWHMDQVNQDYRSGRHKIAPQMEEGEIPGEGYEEESEVGEGGTN